MYNNVEVKITVKVDGKRVGRKKLTAASVSSLREGQVLRDRSMAAVAELANELRVKVGV